MRIFFVETGTDVVLYSVTDGCRQDYHVGDQVLISAAHQGNTFEVSGVISVVQHGFAEQEGLPPAHILTVFVTLNPAQEELNE